MSINAPTIVLVHGAFAESASWSPVIECLNHHHTQLVATHQRRFHDVVAVGNPLRSLNGDAQYVTDVLRSIDGPIVLVGHSYGGMVITQAASGCDAVAALVYVAAFTPDHRESAFQLSMMFPGSTLGDALTSYPLSSGGEEVAIHRDLFHDQFAADMSHEGAALMAATQRPVTVAALSEGIAAERPAWKDVPAWFVYGEQDRNIPAALVRFQAERAGARGLREIKGGSHAISVSSPEIVADVILDAVEAVAPLEPVTAG